MLPSGKAACMWVLNKMMLTPWCREVSFDKYTHPMRHNSSCWFDVMHCVYSEPQFCKMKFHNRICNYSPINRRWNSNVCAHFSWLPLPHPIWTRRRHPHHPHLDLYPVSRKTFTFYFWEITRPKVTESKTVILQQYFIHVRPNIYTVTKQKGFTLCRVQMKIITSFLYKLLLNIVGKLFYQTFRVVSPQCELGNLTIIWCQIFWGWLCTKNYKNGKVHFLLSWSKHKKGEC